MANLLDIAVQVYNVTFLLTLNVYIELHIECCCIELHYSGRCFSIFTDAWIKL